MTRHLLSVSFDVGNRQTVTCDSEQECRNELADIITRTNNRGTNSVVAWNITPTLSIAASDTGG